MGKILVGDNEERTSVSHIPESYDDRPPGCGEIVEIVSLSGGSNLVMIDFTWRILYNNNSQESTKMSPFFANYGFHPRFLVESRNPVLLSSHAALAAEDFTSYLCEVHNRLVQNVKHSQDLQAKYYDAKHKPVEFQPCDLVWLNSSNLSTSHPSKKLDWKHLGPFKVVKRIGLQAYKLELPATMCHIHNTFHVSLLDPVKSTPLVPTPHGLPPTPPALYIKDDQEYFEIEDILNSCHVKNHLEYQVKWKGYPDSDNS